MLDVCVALTERADEAEQMAKVVKLLSMTVEAPLMIDSTEPAVIARALEHVPGRAIMNSINMENGRERIDRVVPLAKHHGAALVALTIDESGMAKTRERKLEVAQKIHDIVVGEYGLAPEDLIYDALTFTLATGDAEWIDSAVETIEGIRLIKRELPGVFTILGVSQRELRAHAGRARGAQLRVPAPLRAGGARHGDRESGARPAVRRDRGRRSARWPTISCSTKRPDALAAVHSSILCRPPASRLVGQAPRRRRIRPPE